MKKFLMVTVLVLTVGALFGCSGGFIADYSTEEFETALNNGEDVSGKTVVVKVNQMEPNSKLGYNMQAGQNLNFVSSVDPKVEPGDEIVVTVDRVATMFDAFIITYK